MIHTIKISLSTILTIDNLILYKKLMKLIFLVNNHLIIVNLVDYSKKEDIINVKKLIIKRKTIKI
jgi:hypothetical protein